MYQTNNIYIGKVTWDSLETDSQHEAIIDIDLELFEKVQQQIKRNTRNPGLGKQRLAKEFTNYLCSYNSFLSKNEFFSTIV